MPPGDDVRRSHLVVTAFHQIRAPMKLGRKI
jgi:hypothetical protein